MLANYVYEYMKNHSIYLIEQSKKNSTHFLINNNSFYVTKIPNIRRSYRIPRQHPKCCPKSTISK